MFLTGGSQVFGHIRAVCANRRPEPRHRSQYNSHCQNIPFQRLNVKRRNNKPGRLIQSPVGQADDQMSAHKTRGCPEEADSHSFQ